MNTFTNWQIFVGCESNGKAIPQKRLDVAIDKAVDVLAQMFGGCTLQHGVGAWGTTREDTIIISVLTDLPNDSTIDTIIGVAGTLKDTLKQEAVLVTKSTIEAAFI